MAAWVERRGVRGLASLRVAGLLAAVAAVVFAAVPHFIVALSHWPAAERALSDGGSLTGGLVYLAFVPPAALVASILPLLAAAGRRAGATSFAPLYAMNTLGSVLGSLLVGAVLLKVIGVGLSALVLEAVLLVTAMVLLRGASTASSEGSDPRQPQLVWLLVSTMGVAVFHTSLDLPLDILRHRIPAGAEVVALHEGHDSTVMVVDEQDAGRRRLWINSSWVAGTGGTHSALGHLPALLVDSPRHALGIALGTGQTFAAVLRHGVDRVDCVELDPGVIALSRRYFAQANNGLLEDPRVTVHNTDGRAHLRTTTTSYDVIVLEPLQTWSAGTASLYSREFYEEAQRVLRDDGVLGQWIPFYGQDVDDTRAMVATALAVFPHASLWVDGADGILLVSKAPFSLSLLALETRLRERGLRGELAQDGVASADDLAAMLWAGPHEIAAWTAGAAVFEDDRPAIEFRAARGLGVDQEAAIVASAGAHRADPASYAQPAASEDERRRLHLAGRVRDAVLAAHWLKQDSRGVPAGRVALLEEILPDAATSPFWRSAYRDAVVQLARSPGVDAVTVYRQALARVPGIPELELNLRLLTASPDAVAPATP